MQLSEFRDRVITQFGPRLERATPATVEEFLESVSAEMSQRDEEESGAVNVDETAHSWEQVIHEFLGLVLEQPTESRFIQLWLLGLMLHFQSLNEAYADQFADLFRRRPDADPRD